MMLCPAATTAAAIFTALVVIDIYNKNYKDIVFHIVGGIVAILGLNTMCDLTSDLGGWVLLGIPFFVLIIGFYIQWAEGQRPTPTAPAPNLSADNCCPRCSSCPCTCQQWPTDCDGVPLPKPTPPATVNTDNKPFGCPRKTA